ncbi:MAG: DinB family protein [Candidatus Hodarchaeota archaeon]
MAQVEIVQLMLWELERGYQLLESSLNQISKKEAQWKPSSNARTLDTIRSWNMYGDDFLKSKQFDPLSTIEFKILHLAQCKLMYDEYAFREGALRWKDLECPEWPNCKDYLKDSQTKLVESLQSLTDPDLNTLVPTNWGEKWLIKQIIAVMTHHDAYHLGQICMMKNLHHLIENPSRKV